jgi:hypothetical protein
VLAGVIGVVIGDTLASGAKETAMGIWNAVTELNE